MTLSVKSTIVCTVGTIKLMVIRIAAYGQHLDACHIYICIQDSLSRSLSVIYQIREPSECIAIIEVIYTVFVGIALSSVHKADCAISILIELM